MRFEPRVLLIEDDAEVAQQLSRLLQRLKLDYTLAADAAGGLLLLQRTSFDLVLADRDLPGETGLSLLAQVKEVQQEVDVILMAAVVDMGEILEAMAAGVYDYLLKPLVSLEAVEKKILRALEKRRMVLENRHLIRYLSQANTQIEDMNRALEVEVAERTQQLRQANQRLEQLSLTDDVTGLFNQRFLFSRLEEEFQRARRYSTGFAVMMLDLDNFKQVNDRHDHLFGSRVLRRVGQLLQQSVRDTDLVVRYGGDEFAILMPHTSMLDAVRIGERIRISLMSQAMGDAAVPWQVTVSVGVAGMEVCHSVSGRELLRAADLALYCAKAAGRNQVHAAPPVKVAQA